jgi:periplasmic protein TonB
MGYQALLFCPDEKTARTVTQVLSELDFEVVPCTEPFAAVKKLMGEHFDAVVVDCDNEQNATLLFKSARNSPNNQSALAVAVVEGQAGVAKAFRIGANLVLTKPINVEQAKGTLRVARGLLRKNEGAKQTGATPATPKPPTPAPPPAKPTLVPNIATTRPVSSVSAFPPPSVPVEKPASQSSFAASASTSPAASEESNASVEASHTQTTPNVVSIVSDHKPEIISSKPEIPAATKTGPSIASSSGAASAPAPAREDSTSIGAQHKSSTVISELQAPVTGSASEAETSRPAETVLPAPLLSFGGAVESGTKSSDSGSKKILAAVAAVVVIAAGGYVAWTQFARPSRPTAPSAQVAARPVAPTTTQATPTTTATAPTTAATVETPAFTVNSKSTKSAKTSDTTKTNPAENSAKDHQSKANSEPSKPAVDDVVAVNSPATSALTQPLVVKKGSGEATLGKSSPTDAPMPSITGIAAAGSGGTLPNLLGNQTHSPAPVLQTLSISQGVSQGLAIKKTPPSYPTNALRLRIEGPVQLMATISKKGDISAVKIISGDPSLARAAVEAVKQWKYRPYLLDGSPVEIQTQITVNFKLPR